MKLELKHIAPYLPYGLNAQDLRTKEVRTVTLLHFTYDLKTVGHNHLLYDGLLISKHLPILRPLSDLTQEIEVNGEKFIPQDKMKYLDLEWLINSDNLIMKTNYEDVLKLLEWHFDIFRLIESALAVSIHDVCKADA